MMTEAAVSTTATVVISNSLRYCRQHAATSGAAAITIEADTYTVGTYPAVTADASSTVSITKGTRQFLLQREVYRQELEGATSIGRSGDGEK